MSYRLLDSGDRSILEQFGSKILARPSSQAVWSKRLSAQEWKAADATYDPDSGWSFKSGSFENWELTLEGFKLLLRVQKNGQVGFFPEHLQYMPEVKKFISENSEPSVLNLFAYTGMCSVAATLAGASVCHVDSAKVAINWAKQNFELNGIADRVRCLCDDAVTFVEKEIRRGKNYNLIVADPPSFSRIANRSWNVEDIISDFINSILELLAENGMLVLTSHSPAVNSDTMRNLLLDQGISANSISSGTLYISEESSSRNIPKGYYTLVSLT